MPNRKPSPVLSAAAALVAAGTVSYLVYQNVVRPWHLRWGATEEEISASLPGDELVPRPLSISNRAITIHAPASAIWPWLVQMGGDKGGLYSYTWLEKMVNCPIVNADRIHPEWQELKVGDLVKMCPNEPAPPPYIVAAIDPGRALVLGHHPQEDPGGWSDTWAFVLRPIDDQATRLVLRTRSAIAESWWRIIEPGVFLMEQGMLRGIRDRAESRLQ